MRQWHVRGGDQKDGTRISKGSGEIKDEDSGSV